MLANSSWGGHREPGDGPQNFGRRGRSLKINPKEENVELMNIDTRRIGEKGREIFKRISEESAKDYWGKFTAIEVDSRETFIGDTSIEANNKAREKYPGKVFYLGRIGF